MWATITRTRILAVAQTLLTATYTSPPTARLGNPTPKDHNMLLVGLIAKST
jgi:hypothetical protein